MLNRLADLYRIFYHLSVLATEIKFCGSLNLNDLSICMEQVVRDLLNKMTWMGWNLVNLNAKEANAASVDLADENAKVSIQVTADDSSTKVKKTLEEFFLHYREKTYNKLIVLVLTTKKPCPNTWNFTVEFDWDENGKRTKRKKGKNKAAEAIPVNRQQPNTELKETEPVHLEVWDFSTLVKNINYKSSADALKNIADLLEKEVVPRHNWQAEALRVIRSGIDSQFVEITRELAPDLAGDLRSESEIQTMEEETNLVARETLKSANIVDNHDTNNFLENHDPGSIENEDAWDALIAMLSDEEFGESPTAMEIKKNAVIVKIKETMDEHNISLEDIKRVVEDVKFADQRKNPGLRQRLEKMLQQCEGTAAENHPQYHVLKERVKVLEIVEWMENNGISLDDLK